MSNKELLEAQNDPLWESHKIGNEYLLKGSDKIWKIAYYPIFFNGKTGEVYKEPRAVVETPIEGGIDFREVPLRYLTLHKIIESVVTISKFGHQLSVKEWYKENINLWDAVLFPHPSGTVRDLISHNALFIFMDKYADDKASVSNDDSFREGRLSVIAEMIQFCDKEAKEIYILNLDNFSISKRCTITGHVQAYAKIKQKLKVKLRNSSK